MTLYYLQLVVKEWVKTPLCHLEGIPKLNYNVMLMRTQKPAVLTVMKFSNVTLKQFTKVRKLTEFT